MSAAPLAVAALFWAGGLARAPSALRQPGRRPLCGALLAFAVALTVNVPAVYVRVNGWLGVPNVADLMEHVFGMLGVFAMLAALRGLVGHGARPRWAGARVAVLACAVGASVGLFAAARLPVEAPDFTDRYGGLPLIAAYWSITVAYFGVALAELAQVVVTGSRSARRLALRVGLRAVGAGVVLGVVYSAIKIVEPVVDEDSAAGGVRRAADRLDPVVLVTGAAVIGVGLLLPAADTARRQVSEGARQRVALLRLRPLWRDLTAAMPEVVLGEPPSLWADLWGRDASFRLYRRTIEIRDVALAARVGEWAPTLPSERLAAVLDRLAGASAPAGAAADAPDGEDAERELRPLLELAAEWRQALGRRHRGGLAA